MQLGRFFGGGGHNREYRAQARISREAEHVMQGTPRIRIPFAVWWISASGGVPVYNEAVEIEGKYTRPWLYRRRPDCPLDLFGAVWPVRSTPASIVSFNPAAWPPQATSLTPGKAPSIKLTAIRQLLSTTDHTSRGLSGSRTGRNSCLVIDALSLPIHGPETSSRVPWNSWPLFSIQYDCHHWRRR